LPVIFYQDCWQPWIDDRRNGDAVKFMLRPFTAEKMNCYRGLSWQTWRIGRASWGESGKKDSGDLRLAGVTAGN
jgi:hypothetical protein